MSSLVSIVPNFELPTEENFNRRIEEFRQMAYQELEHIRNLSKSLNRDIQEAILTVFDERINHIIQEYKNLKGSYFNDARAFNNGFKRVVDEYNSTILSVKTLIKEIEILRHLKGFSFYRQLAKILKGKKEMTDFVKVFTGIFVSYFEKEISELERWVVSVPEEELKSVMLSYIEKNKRRTISEYKSLEELVDTAEELVNEIKKLQKHFQEASSKFSVGSPEFYAYISKLEDIHGEISVKLNEIAFIKSQSREIQKDIDRVYQEYLQSLRASQKQYKIKEDEEKYKNQIKDYITLIKNINSDFHEKEIRKLEEDIEKADIFRLKLLLEDTKLKYLKIKKLTVEDSVYRSELERLKSYTSDESLLSKIDKVLLKEYVSREDYEIIYRDFLDTQEAGEKSKEEMLSYIEEKFRQMGYKIVEQDEYGVIYLDTPMGQEYKVRIKFEGERMTIQFVRYIEVDESELSEYEKSVDIAKAKTFCQNLSELLEYISKELGIIIKEEMRI
ncbi:MAG: hypothetical protein NZL86_04825, partial [Aquificaceae bacterium]|nr:hypothetical protein [Aquificaceae bacterium]